MSVRFDGASEVCADDDARRLLALEAFCDPITTTMLSGVRPARDWRCLEVGAGRGSIARWLAVRCPLGTVTATDTDIRHLAGMRIPNVRVRRHDVVDGPGLPEGSFDLAHARALLVHLPDRLAVLRRVQTWLAPGGWLVMEEPVLMTAPHRESPLHRALAGFERLMAEQLGSDFRWPRRLPAALSAAGFAEVRSTTIPVVTNRTSAINEFWRINLTQLGPDLVDAGFVDSTTLTDALSTLDDPRHVEAIMAFVCVSCRRRTGPCPSEEAPPPADRRDVQWIPAQAGD